MPSDDFPAGWADRGRRLARSIAHVGSAQVEETRLTDHLILFTLLPPNPRAAEICLIVSPYEVILTAGRGTRFDLDALPASAEEVTALAFAIAGGGLTERVRGNRVVDFTLRLDDGTHRREGWRWGFPWRFPWMDEAKIEYPPYRDNG